MLVGGQRSNSRPKHWQTGEERRLQDEARQNSGQIGSFRFGERRKIDSARAVYLKTFRKGNLASEHFPLWENVTC